MPVSKGFEFEVLDGEFTLAENKSFLEGKPSNGTCTFKIVKIQMYEPEPEDPDSSERFEEF